MAKIKFTQLFNESMSVDEIEEILSNKLTGDELEGFKKDWADFEDDIIGKDDIVSKYEAKAEELSKEATDVTEGNSENEEGSENVENGSVLTKEEIEEEAEESAKAEEAIEEKAFQSGGNGNTLKVDANTKRLLKTCYYLGINKDDFAEFEDYFAYDDNHKAKDSIKVMFSNNANYPAGREIKKDDPKFKSVAAMNEFALYRMATELYNNLGYGDKLLGIISKYSVEGKEGNLKIKAAAEEIRKNVSEVLKSIRTDEAEVTNPVTAEPMKVKATLLPFLYTKIVGAIMARVNGGPSSSARTSILKPGIYQDFYKAAAGADTKSDIIMDCIYDGYITFLSGGYGIRAFRQDSLGTPHVGTAGAVSLTVFDSGLTEFSQDKNPFLRMEAAMENEMADWGWDGLKKLRGGKGRIKTLGVTRDAMKAANGDTTIDAIQTDYDTGIKGEKDYKDDINSVGEAKSRVANVKSIASPFAVIAAKVAGQYGNYVAGMTRAGFKILTGIPAGANGNTLYGSRYYSAQDIAEAKTDKEREEMKASNDKWVELLKAKTVSLDTPVGEDGKSTLLDSIDDKISKVGNGIDSLTKSEYKKEIAGYLADLENCIEQRYNFIFTLDNNKLAKNWKADDKTTLTRIRLLFGLQSTLKFIHCKLSNKSLSVRSATDFVIGHGMVDKKTGKPKAHSRPQTMADAGVRSSEIGDILDKHDADYQKDHNVYNWGMADLALSNATTNAVSPKAFYVYKNVEGGPEMLDKFKEYLQKRNDDCAETLLIICMEFDKKGVDIYKEKILDEKFNKFGKPMAARIAKAGEEIPEIATKDIFGKDITLTGLEIPGEHFTPPKEDSSYVEWITAFMIDMSGGERVYKTLSNEQKKAAGDRDLSNYRFTNKNAPRNVCDTQSAKTYKKIGDNLYTDEAGKICVVNPLSNDETILGKTMESQDFDDFFMEVFNEASEK